ncbi:hypothetical protein Clacol_004642 [Clathrus columnatus]|uniref:Ubiquitin-like domain-containing protein n=1 Tax=Clathrus columnatus TaxID=1419009 RepID=A0AAV5AD47_9AGAM|nr:hypothetical protein Clacol_004642 [Clathrus columnatus]
MVTLIRSYPFQPEPTVHLLRARIHLQLSAISELEEPGRTNVNENLGLCERGALSVNGLKNFLSWLLRLNHVKAKAKEKIILHKSSNVNLDEPIRNYTLSWHGMLPRMVINSSVKLFFSLDSVQGIPIRINLDINQPFSYYGICNNGTIQIVYETSFQAPIIRSNSKYTFIRRNYQSFPLTPGYPIAKSRRSMSMRAKAGSGWLFPPGRDSNVLQAKYNWDGKILHPFIKGVPLERNTLLKVIQTSQQASAGWVYGYPLSPSDSTSPSWPLLSSSSKEARGYFPETFVSAVKENAEEGLEVTDGILGDTPPLPPFQFPLADGMIFHMPISDKGHSFLKIMANYEFISSPIDPTHVTKTIRCSTHDIRRVSSISLFIQTPHTTVIDIQVCDNEAHKEEIHTDKEVTESRSRQTHFDGITIGTHGTTVGFQGGMSKGRSIGSTEKGNRISRRKVDAGVYNDNTIFWNLKAPATKLDEDGLIGEESITFVLTKKPVQFRVDNFKDRESLAVYELPEGSTVLDLKTEIESTEGIPLGHQRLVYVDLEKDKDLEDNVTLDFLIRSCPHQDEPIIRLLRARIYAQLIPTLEDSGRASHLIESPGLRERGVSSVDCPKGLFSNLLRLDPAEEIIHHTSCDVDLDKPICTSLSWRRILGSLRNITHPSSVKLFFSDSIQAPITILDVNQPFSYYGICSGSTIQLVYKTRSPRPTPTIVSKSDSSDIIFGVPAKWTDWAVEAVDLENPDLSLSLSDSDVFIFQAKYNWDGKIMVICLLNFLPIAVHHQAISSRMDIRISAQPIELNIIFQLAAVFLFQKGQDLLPRIIRFCNQLFRRRENAEEGLETTDDILGEPPPLPSFHFPPADRMTFHMPISDKGHSFLKIMANYELISSPVDPTHVTMTLQCSTHGIRRVSSVSLFIETPDTAISEVQVCDNEAHREGIYIDKEVTESRSRQTYFDGVNIGTHGTTVGFQGGISKGYSFSSSEKGSRISRRKVDAGVYNDNTIFWNLKAPTTKLDEDGLTGEESITFVLTKKPVEFRVVYSFNELMTATFLSLLMKKIGGGDELHHSNSQPYGRWERIYLYSRHLNTSVNPPPFLLMVTIRVDNFKDRDSFAVYELPEGSLVLDLKIEIESTEGIPSGHQRLVWADLDKDKDLEDNENLDFLIRNSYPHQHEPIIHLLQARIYAQLIPTLEDSGKTSYSIENPGLSERGMSSVDCPKELFPVY